VITAAPPIRHEVVLGRSEHGRPIVAWETGDPQAKRRVLVVGCIHGNEPGGIAIADAVVRARVPAGTDVWVVPDLNPDGVAAGTRQNARGVDLNRNFPAGWRPIGGRGDPQYSGPRPFSEPETRVAARLIRALAPEATIWFHQYRGNRPFVRAWGQSVPAGRRFAGLARMRFRLLPWMAGTAPNWQNHRFPQTSSFVVELPRGALGSAMESRLTRAVDRFGRKVSED
jgi:murein peptide amidase A